MAGRLLLAAAMLVPVLIASTGLREALRALRHLWLIGLVSGIVNAALPFTLIAWGQTHIDSGTAAIANASMPIFVVLLALRVRKSESARGSRLAGVLLGFVGVGVLAGANPPGGWWGVAGTMAVVVAAFCLRGRRPVRAAPHRGRARPRLLDRAVGGRRARPSAVRDCAAPVGGSRVEGDRVSPRPRDRRHGGRDASLLPPGQPARLSAREPRRLPAAAVRAPVRGDPPGRVAEPAEADRARAHPGWRRSRFGSRLVGPPAGAGARNERPHSPRDRGRRRLPARAREPRGRRAVHVGPSRARSRNAARGDRALRTGAASRAAGS